MVSHLTILGLYVYYKMKKRRSNPINKNRINESEYFNTFPRLVECPTKFYNYFRMTRETFYYILGKIAPSIEPKRTNFIKTNISAEEKLMITLRYLACGSSYPSISYSHKIGISTINSILVQTCQAICNHFHSIHLKNPTQNDLEKIANEFYQKWNFPNCIGALDGKHCEIKKPGNSGSSFHNYKHFFSIVLQGLVDAHYRFIAIDVGGKGSESDGGIFSNSVLFKSIENGTFPIPPPKKLPNSDIVAPHVFVADDAYPLKSYIMKPFRGIGTISQRHYNYRLSRARRLVECAFGILTAKWRILARAMDTKPATTDLIIKTCVILHNMIIDKENPHMSSDFEHVKGRQIFNYQSIKNSTKEAQLTRELFKEFFDQNSLPWKFF